MYRRAKLAITKRNSLIYVAPGIPILYLRNTEKNDENGINTRKKRTKISKIETLEIEKNHLKKAFEDIMESKKSLANNKDFYRICKQ